MITKQKYITFTVLLGVSLLIGIILPVLINQNQSNEKAAGELNPKPTTTVLPTPVASLGELLDTSEGLEQQTRARSNCTYPLRYWQNQSETWPAQIAIGGKVYQKDEISDFLNILDPDIHGYLTQQIFVALLNVLYGASGGAIEDILFEADQWLEDNPTGKNLSEFTRREGLYSAQILETFNDGDFGPGPCPDVPEVVALNPSPTTTSTALPVDEPSIVQQGGGPVSTQSPSLPPPAPAPVEPVPTEPSPVEPPPPPSTPVPADPSPTTQPPPPPATSTPAPPTQAPPTPIPVPTEVEETRHPRGEALARSYNVPYEEIMGWNSQGFGFGDIDRVYGLSQETGVPVGDIFAMLESGLGWGEIKKRLSDDDDDDDEDDDDDDDDD